MTYYTIANDAEVRVVGFFGDEQEDFGTDTFGNDKTFNETWFRGYHPCQCCEKLTAVFYTGDIKQGNRTYHCYVIADADDVTESEV